MLIHEGNQNSEEWYQLKLGKFSASSANDLYMKPSTQTYKDLINKVAYERLTGKQSESFSNFWTERGHELEPEARTDFMLRNGVYVKKVMFIELNDWVGCSPDGLIGEDGLIEIKCPKFSTHINYILDQKVPLNYMRQIQFQLMVTGREWCNFYSYHPDLKPLLIRVERDEKMIDEIRNKLVEAIDESKLRIEALK